MIELRWLQEKGYWECGEFGDRYHSPDKPVLQMRQQTQGAVAGFGSLVQPHLSHLVAWDWTEWRDIPVVEEKSDE